jgi:aminoglycoside 3-N-acetyltransferase I
MELRFSMPKRRLTDAAKKQRLMRRVASRQVHPLSPSLDEMPPTRCSSTELTMTTSYTIQQLAPDDVSLLRSMMAMFADAFEDQETYGAQPPTDEYIKGLLAKSNVIALVARANEVVTGGLVAYQLDKFERARSEVYIYDLAVAATERRRGIATSLIARLREIAAERGAWVIYVQADYVDPPAIALYEKLGTREEVLHFDIDVAGAFPMNSRFT